MSAALLGFTPIAQAQEAEVAADAPPRRLASGLPISLRIEPGLAMALTAPQSDMTTPGFGQTVKLMFGLNRYLGLGPSATFTTLPAEPAMTDAGTAWSAGASARLMRPRDAAPGRRGIHAASPWVDADLLYVRTGVLNRPGIAAGGGVAIPLDDNRRYWLGPYLRYSHILQGERVNYDNRDAKLLTIGLSLEVGTGLAPQRRRRAPEPAPAVVVAEVPVAIEPAPVSDRDGDGIADDSDACPEVAGPAESTGCPPREVVVVAPQPLELEQKVAFAWNSAILEDSSFPALDQVVLALDANRAVKVQVSGHASSDGGEAHNRRLSTHRATAVVDYLSARGIDRDRLESKGFGSSEPSHSNRTRAGRRSNRRVEFVVTFILVATQGNTP